MLSYLAGQFFDSNRFLPLFLQDAALDRLLAEEGDFALRVADGTRKFDSEGWEAAIQKVLSACKEFNIQCGYPATENDIEARMKQGFSVFVMNWGDPGFEAIKIGKKAAGR